MRTKMSMTTMREKQKHAKPLQDQVFVGQWYIGVERYVFYEWSLYHLKCTGPKRLYTERTPQPNVVYIVMTKWNQAFTMLSHLVAVIITHNANTRIKPCVSVWVCVCVCVHERQSKFMCTYQCNCSLWRWVFFYIKPSTFGCFGWNDLAAA